MQKHTKKQQEFGEIGRAVEQQFQIKIASDGRWYHEGGEIHRKALVKLFSTVLKRDSKGIFWLETPVEKGRIEVEDAPFIATALTVDDADGEIPGTHPGLRLITNVDDMYHLMQRIHCKCCQAWTGLICNPTLRFVMACSPNSAVLSIMSSRRGLKLAMMVVLAFGAMTIFLFWSDASRDRFFF